MTQDQCQGLGPNSQGQGQGLDAQGQGQGLDAQGQGQGQGHIFLSQGLGPNSQVHGHKKLKARTRTRACPSGTNSLIQMNVTISKFKFIVINNTSHTMHNLILHQSLTRHTMPKIKIAITCLSQV